MFVIRAIEGIRYIQMNPFTIVKKTCYDAFFNRSASETIWILSSTFLRQKGARLLNQVPLFRYNHTLILFARTELRSVLDRLGQSLSREFNARTSCTMSVYTKHFVPRPLLLSKGAVAHVLQGSDKQLNETV